MKETSSTAINIESPCEHDVKVDIQNGQIITYCSKCGIILDTKPTFRPYGGI